MFVTRSPVRPSRHGGEGGCHRRGQAEHAETANDVCAELRELNGPVDVDDFVVDLCFMTYVAGGLGSDHAAGTGIRAGMVGRKQRRFVVNLEVPPELADHGACRSWIAGALAEAAVITREQLPGRSRAYPAERLAGEIESLRDRWIEHTNAF